jgi:hypothetical protein
VQFLAAELDHLGIGLTPQLVAFVAEVLETEPDFVRIGHQVGTPVVEYLQSAELYFPLLNVDPVILQQLLAADMSAVVSRFADTDKK